MNFIDFGFHWKQYFLEWFSIISLKTKRKKNYSFMRSWWTKSGRTQYAWWRLVWQNWTSECREWHLWIIWDLWNKRFSGAYNELYCAVCHKEFSISTIFRLHHSSDKIYEWAKLKSKSHRTVELCDFVWICCASDFW